MKNSNIELNEKQNAFCNEYVKDFNSAQSCIRAGYSEKTARIIGCNLLTKVNIQNRIVELLKKISMENQIHEVQIIAELKRIAFSDIANYVDEEGHINSFREIDTTVISQLNTMEMENEKKGYTRISKKIKLHDKIKALELLGKYKCLWTDIHKIEPVESSPLAESIKALREQYKNGEIDINGIDNVKPKTD